MNRFAASPFPAAAEMPDSASVLRALVLPQYTLPPTTEWPTSRRRFSCASNVSELATKRHKIHRCVCERLCLFAAIPTPSHGSCREWFLQRTSKQQMTSPDVLYRVARFLPPT